ncbi:MAG: hypothetical protein ACE365_07460 [Gammaproteobacteria bacterium]
MNTTQKNSIRLAGLLTFIFRGISLFYVYSKLFNQRSVVISATLTNSCLMFFGLTESVNKALAPDERTSINGYQNNDYGLKDLQRQQDDPKPILLSAVMYTSLFILCLLQGAVAFISCKDFDDDKSITSPLSWLYTSLGILSMLFISISNGTFRYEDIQNAIIDKPTLSQAIKAIKKHPAAFTSSAMIVLAAAHGFGAFSAYYAELADDYFGLSDHHGLDWLVSATQWIALIACSLNQAQVTRNPIYSQMKNPSSLLAPFRKNNRPDFPFLTFFIAGVAVVDSVFNTLASYQTLSGWIGLRLITSIGYGAVNYLYFGVKTIEYASDLDDRIYTFFNNYRHSETRRVEKDRDYGTNVAYEPLNTKEDEEDFETQSPTNNPSPTVFF